MQDTPLKWYTAIFLVILLFVFFVFALYFQVVAHEYAHQDVYRIYGINSSIEYNFNPFNGKDYAGLTIPDRNNSSICDSGCLQTHAQIEVIGNFIDYVLVMLFSAIGLVLTIHFYKNLT